MNSRQCSVAFTIFIMSLCGSVQSQDLDDFFGTWSVTASGPSGDQNCGQMYISGELRVLQRATFGEGVVYQGVVTAETKFEQCEKISSSESRAFLFVNGDRVQVSYENQNWTPDFLVRSGDVMKGPSSTGLVGHWVKQSGPSDSARAAEAKKNIAQAAYDRSADQIRQVLLSRGYDESKAESLLWQHFDGAAACQVDTLMVAAAEQSLSFYELVNMIDPVSGGLTNMDLNESFDSKPHNLRMNLCFKESDKMLGMDFVMRK